MEDARAATKGIPNAAALAAELAPRHTADIVETLNRLPGSPYGVLAYLPQDRAVEVLDSPEFNASADVFRDLPAEQAASLIGAMSADRAAEILRQLEPNRRLGLISRLDAETRSSLERLLAYPPNTAGSLMTTEFVSVPADWTIRAVLEHIRKVERTRETVYAIYVVDPATGRLMCASSLRRLITGRLDDSILSVCAAHDPVVATPLMDSEDVTRLIAKYDLLAVPVVDSDGHILGIVTVDDIIDTMMDQSTEEVQRFGGMETIDQPYFAAGFLELVRKRGGWLAALFLGEMLTASAMQFYEAELAKAVVLTLFIPLIMSSGGNSGSQATSLLIRAFALQEVKPRDWWRVALREFPMGMALGAILAVIGMGRIALWQATGLYDYGEHWGLVTLTVGVALVGIVTFGSLAGSMLPFIMRALHLDAATASAPFVATLVDVTGIVIYFSIAVVLLSGTLL